MKKTVTFTLLFSLLLTGCQALSQNPPQEKKDLADFLLDFENAYCTTKKIDFIFWQKYSAPKYQQEYIQPGGNDVPLMRWLGNDGLNYLNINNTQSEFDKITNSSFKSDFSESIRLENLGFEFLKKYLTTNSTLKSFEQFRDEAAPSLLGFRQTMPKIEPQFRDDYKNFIVKHPNLVAPENEGLLAIDNICTTLMPDLTRNELQGVPYDPDSQALTKIDLNLWQPPNTQESKKTAFIKVNQQKNYPRLSNNAININGTISDNCSSIEVNAVNVEAGVNDKYILNNYKKGDTTFKYGIREDWNNLGPGNNTYTFIAHCEDEQNVQDKLIITMPTLLPIFNNTNSYNADYQPSSNYYLPTSNVIETKIDGEFEGWEGETIFKMMDGSIWQQSSYAYNYHYAYMPDVLIYRKNGNYYMKVEDVEDTIQVTRLK